MRLIPISYSLILAMFLSVVLVVHAQTLPDNLSQSENATSDELLRISSMKKHNFLGSDMIIEEKLPRGENYDRYIASYLSEGNKIFGLLTIPTGKVPNYGHPAILVVHGYVPPNEYDTKTEYHQFVDTLAKEGYVIFKPDLRGHGNSEGVAEGAYFSSAYTIDIHNAISSLEQMSQVDGGKIGIGGHSMGGNIILRVLVTSSKLKVAVIMSGVVGTYNDILYGWKSAREWHESNGHPGYVLPDTIIEQFGSLHANPQYWNSISLNAYFSDISTPIQIHHGMKDEVVPYFFSEKLHSHLERLSKKSEIYLYSNGAHMFEGENLDTAEERMLQFFSDYLQ